MIETKTTCYHCGDPCPDTQQTIEDKSFCCPGCKMVYEILNQHQLCTYYELNRHPGQPQACRAGKERFAFLDKTEMIEAMVSFSDGKQTHLTLSVPQMHCSSCLWLLENLHQLQDGVLSARVNFPAKEVSVVFDPSQVSLRQIVETLTDIGYEPYLSPEGSSRPQRQPSGRIMQMSIAGFCFANIMMLSLPEYFSVAGFLHDQVGTAFRYIGLLLALPVFFYSAREFFVNAWQGIRNRRLTIDTSIVLAILLTFLRSLYNLFFLNGNTYFDSMSGIVFFMLIGRWAQDKSQQFLVFDRDYRSFFPVAVNVKHADGMDSVLISALKEKDIIEVYDQEIIPADSLLIKGKALIDYSFVTGESLPRPVDPGALIYAGGKQIGERLELMVMKRSDQGYLTHLWNRDETEEREGEHRFLYRAANGFTLCVLLLTLAGALFWLLKGETVLMWNTLTTTLIVACPCALLLAATFTNGNVIRILKRSGLFLKNAAVIDKMAAVDHVVLDKTGTITLNKNFKVIYQGSSLNAGEKLLMASLLKHSTHPLSRAVLAETDVEGSIAVDSFKNLPGLGIEGWLDDHHVKIGSYLFVGAAGTQTGTENARVYIKIDHSIPGFYELENRYRSGFRSFAKRIQKDKLLSVLSGDNNASYHRLREITGPSAVLCFDQSPEDKYRYIKMLQEERQQKVLMAGDGLNDGAALRRADMGIAVMEGGNSFTPASDAIIRAPALTQLDALLRFAAKAGMVIRISFMYSVIYNVIGLFFALQGKLTPVVAAILMPASSVSIILLTFFMTEWYGRKLKRQDTD
ncbi:heavy metal translocating P-type ATPase [Niabella beijingensis]|uniref:heavy metal translocating P-type ATPase n=1 Tax=Niabella beijingensis TaxID=2872700 RepID=UPI001CBEAD01|nr:heavy metal translocating P-type ATPase metal-binding domain-containing protein [Niabella beijingensis]MBZ4191057.1 heavy metal translocating P-type ATPase metal-binding domain-containing protein [Niabella beijingensis]